MTPADIDLMERLEKSDPAAHRCRIYHDAGFLSDDEAQPLIQIGVPLEQSKYGYVRPLCREVDENTVSVGCAHDERFRKAMMAVLCTVAGTATQSQHCVDLFGEVKRIGDEINSRNPKCLDASMARAKSDCTSEGADKRRDIGDRHTELVNRLLEINRESLNLYHTAVEAKNGRILTL